jgi:hypothetical protein
MGGGQDAQAYNMPRVAGGGVGGGQVTGGTQLAFKGRSYSASCRLALRGHEASKSERREEVEVSFPCTCTCLYLYRVSCSSASS